MKTSYIKGLVIFLLLLALVDCQKNTKPIVVGEEVEVTTETIGIGGGTITVSKPGDLLDGFKIEVPGGAYQDEKTFKISYRPIIRHNLGSYFNAITPLITVNNGGEYAEKIMTVTIPVSIPDRYFAMAFFYDETTGKLEGIPLVEENADSITIMTAHFSNVLVSYIEKQILISLEIDTTGFKHGVDDWQFANYGSWVAPKGHCAGQSIAAMYYYTENKLEGKKPSLYGLYDNDGNAAQKTSGFQWDDERAYKLCSMVQKRIQFDNRVRNLIENWQDKFKILDTYNCFAYALLLTKEPQYVAIYRPGSGHAMILYKKSGKQVRNGKDIVAFSVSDPNYPYISEQQKNEREIIYDVQSEKFIPYNSGDNAGSLGKDYPTIIYCAKTALINYTTVGSLWVEMENGTIGTGADGFPSYTLSYKKNGSDQVFTDAFNTNDKNLSIRLCNPQVATRLRFSTYANETFKIDTFEPPPGDFCVSGSITGLKEGENRIGILIEGETAEGWKDNGGSYVGFDWVKINYTKPLVDLAGFNQCTFRFSVVKGRGVDSDGGEYDKYINVDMYPTGTFSGNTFNGTEDRECGEKCKQTGTFRATVDPCADDPTQLCVTSFKAEGLLDMSAQDWTWSIQNNANKPIYEDVKETDRIGFWVFGSSACDYFDTATLKYREQYSGSYVDVLSPYSCDEDSEFEITFNKQ